MTIENCTLSPLLPQSDGRLLETTGFEIIPVDPAVQCVDIYDDISSDGAFIDRVLVKTDIEFKAESWSPSIDCPATHFFMLSAIVDGESIRRPFVIQETGSGHINGFAV
jgi:hypothetical protein